MAYVPLLRSAAAGPTLARATWEREDSGPRLASLQVRQHPVSWPGVKSSAPTRKLGSSLSPKYELGIMDRGNVLVTPKK